MTLTIKRAFTLGGGWMLQPEGIPNCSYTMLVPKTAYGWFTVEMV